MPKELVNAKLTLEDILMRGFRDQYLPVTMNEIQHAREFILRSEQALTLARPFFHALPDDDPLRKKLGELMRVLKRGRNKVRTASYLVEYFLRRLYLEKKRERSSQDAFKGAIRGLRRASDSLAVTEPALTACCQVLREAGTTLSPEEKLRRVNASATVAQVRAQRKAQENRHRRDRAYQDIMLFSWD